ncbi:ExbD/TolR family protein [Hyphomicrobium sp. 2TAF46]|uniref:ExbD/TolR family protein n=1 Tax=Hyphomicrobium sp. 2TAF46 TaxID=3233019 RepID=UPI003F9181C8
MRVWPTKQKRQARIEIIPMIDVMMFLLVFFVLLSINVLPALGLKIKPPTSAKPDQIVERQRVQINLDAAGKTFIDGTPVELVELPDRLNGIADPQKKMTVVIAGDEQAALQSLVGVLDALKLAGIANAQIVARNK